MSGKSKITELEIYTINFEKYLQPKKPQKIRKLQVFDEKQTSVKKSKRKKSAKYDNVLKNQVESLELEKKETKLKTVQPNSSKGKNKNFVNFRTFISKFFDTILSKQNDVLCRRKTGFHIYCELASGHGFMNFLDANLWQRLFWSFLILAAVCLCVVIVTLFHFNNQESLTIFHTEGITYPAWSVPFPAVTICNLNRISKKEANKVANKFLSHSLLSRQQLLEIFPYALYPSHEINATNSDFAALEAVLKRNDYTIDRLLYELSPKCDVEGYIVCKTTGHFERCQRLLKEVITVQGVCCSYNYLASSDNPENVQPVRTFGVDFETGLTILLEPNVGNYTFSMHKFTGYQVFIHDSFDAVDGTTYEYVFPLTETLIGIRPIQSVGTSFLRKKSPQERGCYFPDERKLRTFRRYSQSNCMLECRSLIFHEKCGCVPVFWPKLFNHWRYCESVSEINCSILNKGICTTVVKELEDYYPKTRGSYKILCDCLPSCNANQYMSIIESSPLNRSHKILSRRLFNGAKISGNYILLHVFYDDLISERYRLDVRENWLSILGTVGGIAGFYMGFSFVSFFEIIFLTFVRPASNWVTKQRIKYNLRRRKVPFQGN